MVNVCTINVSKVNISKYWKYSLQKQRVTNYYLPVIVIVINYILNQSIL